MSIDPPATGTAQARKTLRRSSSMAITPKALPTRGARGATSTRSHASRSSTASTASCLSSARGAGGLPALLSCARVLEGAEAEDVEMLAQKLRSGETPSSWRFNFGRGFVFMPPAGWTAERRGRVRRLCTDLGFQAQTQAGKVCYQISNEKVRAGVGHGLKF
jgi:hypothetical protein